MRNELVQTAIDNLLEMFRTQDFPTQTAYMIIRRRAGDVRPSDNWSLGNRLLMLASGSSDCRGFGQWHLAGRHVKAKSRALYIFAPVLIKPTPSESDSDPDESAPRITSFRLIPVFRYEDTEGKPLPAHDYMPHQLPPLFDVAAKLGASVSYQPFNGKALGRYRPGTKEILLSEQSALTFFHELAHHIDESIQSILPGRLAEAEIVAEFSAAVLCSIQNISGYENSTFQYLKAYSSGKDPQAVLRSIMSVASRVEQIVNIVLDAAAIKTEAISPKEPAQSISA